MPIRRTRSRCPPIATSIVSPSTHSQQPHPPRPAAPFAEHAGQAATAPRCRGASGASHGVLSRRSAVLFDVCGHRPIRADRGGQTRLHPLARGTGGADPGNLLPRRRHLGLGRAGARPRRLAAPLRRCSSTRPAGASTCPHGDDPSDGAAIDLYAYFGRAGEVEWLAAGRAVQLVEWARTHRFCGRCGTPTEPADRRAGDACPACGLFAFPRLAPAMITLVTRGERAERRRCSPAACAGPCRCTAASPASSSPASRSSRR